MRISENKLIQNARYIKSTKNRPVEVAVAVVEVLVIIRKIYQVVKENGDVDTTVAVVETHSVNRYGY